MIRTKHVHCIIVGAGFAGLYMLIRLRKAGISAKIIEKAPAVGGTWYSNKYPGAGCDIESVDYSYSFDVDLQKTWTWEKRYASQPEILNYLRFVADKYNLWDDISLDTEVTSATYENELCQWSLATTKENFTCQFLIMATGCLSTPKLPHFPGFDRFKGHVYFTSTWPASAVQIEGKNVGIIGTGASGIQCIPHLARKAKNLYVFQRTANYVIPLWNHSVTDQDRQRNIAEYDSRREKVLKSSFGTSLDGSQRSVLTLTTEDRKREFDKLWEKGGFSFLIGFSDLLVDEKANNTAVEYLERKIKEIVRDPRVAADLTPNGFPFGTKRLCFSDEYYQTYNRENTFLVNLRKTPIYEVTCNGIQTSAKHYEIDTLICATGFDAIVGALNQIKIIGRDKTLKEVWAKSPKSYLGLATAGFPNLFTITGPGSPSVLTNMVCSIEQHCDWIGTCLEYMNTKGFREIEAKEEAQDNWFQHVQDLAAKTLFPKAQSWYCGDNIEGRQHIFMPYVGHLAEYYKKCLQIAVNDYEGFRFK